MVGAADVVALERAAAFWIRFWDDRGPEFRDTAVRSTVRRLSHYGAGTRAADLRALDTFALDTKKGQTKGEDLHDFGAAWYAVSPAGSKVEPADEASATTSGTSSSGYGY